MNINIDLIKFIKRMLILGTVLVLGVNMHSLHKSQKEAANTIEIQQKTLKNLDVKQQALLELIIRNHYTEEKNNV